MNAETVFLALRYTDIAAAMLAFGGVAFALRSGAAARRPLRLAVASLVAGAGAALALAAATGGAESLADPPRFAMILTQTTFGRAADAHVVIAAALVAALLWSRSSPALILGLTGANLVSLGAIGHAGAAAGWAGFMRLAVHSLHLMAGGFWVGALPGLIAALGKGGETARTGLEAFSRYALIAVVAVAFSGLVNAYAATGALLPHIATLYGRLLAAKIAGFALLISVAAINRLYLTPRRAFRPIAGFAWFDLVVFAALLAVAVALGAAPPGGAPPPT